MSQSFRAVTEVWNAHSSCFIEAEKLILLPHDLAARVGDGERRAPESSAGCRACVLLPAAIFLRRRTSVCAIPKGRA
jgi:hypothetical protein